MTFNVAGIGKKSGLLTVISAIIVALAIGAVIYYLQITRNEASQNKLHFQGLKQISVELDNAFLQLDSFAGSQLRLAISGYLRENTKQDDESENKSKVTPKDKQPVISDNRSEKFYSNVLKNAAFNKEPINSGTISRAIGCDNKWDNCASKKISCDEDQLNSSTHQDSVLPKSYSEDDIACIKKILNADNFEIQFEFVRDKQRYGLEQNNVYIEVSKGPIKFTIPFENLLSGNHQQFPKILVANFQGEVLASKEYVEKGSYQSALEFSSVSKILQTVYGANQPSKQNSKQGINPNEDKNKKNDIAKAQQSAPNVPGFSGYSEENIGGNKYRVYVSPYRIKHQGIIDSTYALNNDIYANQYFLLGIKPASDISLEKLSVSPSVGVILMMILLALVSLVPILKVRFVSPNYAFTRSDTWSLSIGLAVLVGLITVSSVDYTFYAQLKRQIHIEALHSFDLLKTEFKTEIMGIKERAKSITMEDTKTKNDDFDKNCEATTLLKNTETEKSVATGSANNNENCNGTTTLASMADTKYSIEEIFKINQNGLTDKDGWSVSQNNESRYANLILNLSFREYFQSAIACKAWQLRLPTNSSVNPDCKDQIYIQRILNLSDGRRTTQFAFPAFTPESGENKDKGNYKGGADYVISAGTMLQTFFEPVLPRNYKFAVFENSTGKVLYHSNDELSLIENFYIATDNNQTLHSIVKQVGFYPQPNYFQGKYKGATHEFVAGPMIAGLPWTLVVFFDKQELRFFNFLLVSSSLIIFLLFTLLLALLISISIDYFPWRTAILFLRKNHKKYTVLFSFLLLLSAAELMSFLVITDLLTRFGVWLCGLSIFLLLMSLTLAKTNNIRFARSRMFRLAVTLGLVSLLVIFSYGKPALTPELFHQHNNIVWVITILFIAICSSVWFYFKYNSPLTGPTSGRYQKRYTVYVITLLIYLAGVPALAVTNSAFWFFVNKAADIQTLHVNSALHGGSEIRRTYHQSIGVDKSADKIRPVTFFVPQSFSDEKLDHQHAWVTEPNLLEQNNNIDPTKRHNPSLLLGLLFRNSNVDLPLPAMLSVLLQNDQTSYDKNSESKVVLPPFSVKVTPANIIETGIQNSRGEYLISALLVLGILYITIRHLLLSRLMGADISGLYHNFGRAEPSQFDDLIYKLLHKPRHKSAFYMLLRPTRKNFNRMIEIVKERQALGAVLDLHEALTEYPNFENNTDNEKNDGVNNHSFLRYIDNLQKEISGSRNDKDILVITKLNSIMFNARQRKNALALLELLARFGHLKIVLVTDVSPLYRLIKQSAFPAIMEDQFANSEEKLRWSSIFSRFEKFYDWHPQQPLPDEFPSNLLDLLKRECNSWPELQNLEHTFCQYHVMHKLKVHWEERAKLEGELQKETDNLTRAEDDLYEQNIKTLETLNTLISVEADKTFSELFSFSKLETALEKCGGLNGSLARHWNASELFEFFCEKAGGIYRYRWEICTKQERILLFQIARGRIVNPHNHDALEHLVRRGYILNRGLWTINCTGFKQFILSAESKSTFQHWMHEYADSNWQYIRIPIFVTITLLFGVILYSATEAYETILGLITASLGLIPLFLKNFASLRGSQNSPNEN